MWDPISFWCQYQLARFKGWCLPSSVRNLRAQYKINRLMRFIQKNLPFYQDYPKRRFEELPIIDKQDVKDNFEKMNKVGLSYDKAKYDNCDHHPYVTNQSLGTSGQQGIYLFSKKEKQYELVNILSKLYPEGGLFAKKVAVFYLSGKPYFTDLKTSCFEWQFYDLHQETADLFLKLNAYSPDIIVAPVQTLCLLCQYQLENKIQLKPQKIVASQEVLMPSEEKLIATTFKQNVHQLYQCAEGFLGSTCEMGTLHLNEDQYYIEKEWIDDKKEKFIPVITSLNRFMQPLIRYRINDIVSVKQSPCVCGSKQMAIEKIIGRCEDMLYFQKYGNTTVLKTIYSDELHLAIASARGGIEKYQLIQSSPLHLSIRLKAKHLHHAKTGIMQHLEKLFQYHNVKCPHFEFSVLENIALSDLFRQTRRLCAHT